MQNQFSYLNNVNKPNLVDLSLLQKINDGYQYTPKISYLYSIIQTAGSTTCTLAKDNLFITVIVFCLILFLGWCYVEKKRQDVLYEKYLQKKLAKSLLNDELNLFSEVPEPINIEKLFNDISQDMAQEIKVPIPVQENLELVVNPEEPIQYQQKPVHMTKREYNMQMSNSNQIMPVQLQPPTIDAAVVSKSGGSRYIDISNFSGSYMLM